MPTKTKPEPLAGQMLRFESKLLEVKKAIAGLPGETYFAQLQKTVRRAGWTTSAEGIFFEAVVESMLTHTRDISQLQQRLKAAFEAVECK